MYNILKYYNFIINNLLGLISKVIVSLQSTM